MSLTDKLMSRKFWLALLACVYFGFNGAFDQIAQVVVAYLAVQAGVDALQSYADGKYGAAD